MTAAPRRMAITIAFFQLLLFSVGAASAERDPAGAEPIEAVKSGDIRHFFLVETGKGCGFAYGIWRAADGHVLFG